MRSAAPSGKSRGFSPNTSLADAVAPMTESRGAASHFKSFTRRPVMRRRRQMLSAALKISLANMTKI